MRLSTCINVVITVLTFLSVFSGLSASYHLIMAAIMAHSWIDSGVAYAWLSGVTFAWAAILAAIVSRIS